MVKSNKLLFIICLILIGCSENDLTGPKSDYQVLIKVEDLNGNPFKPDRVFWYYPPNGQGDTEEFEAESINSDSTEFKVDSAEVGLIYVAAYYRRDRSDHPYCYFHAFDAGPVEIEKNLMKEIRLQMEINETCQ
jgi:hypothetical protein